MKQTIGFCTFCDAFRDMDRNDNFSYDGKKALFDYLEEYEESTGEEIELDVISLCCDYYENDFETIAQDYSIDLSEFEDEDEKIETVEEYLNDNTTVIGRVGNSFVYAAL